MKLKIQTASGKGSALETQAIAHLNPAQSLQQGMKWGGLCFLIAVGCVFIPVLHFVLVPLFLILSIVAFFKGRGAPWKVTNLELICPECGATIKINESFKQAPFRFFCQQCHQHMTAELIEA